MTGPSSTQPDDPGPPDAGDPPGIRPKVPPPPLMGRAPRPGAVRIRRPVVQGVVIAAALLVSGSLAWAFVVQPDLRSRARLAAETERADDGAGSARPSERVMEQPASYDRLPEPRSLRDLSGGRADDPVPDPVSAPARIPSAGYGYGAPPPSVPRSVTQAEAGARAAASGLFFEGGPPVSTLPASSAGAAAPGALPATGSDVYSPHRLTAPVSPYELKAGSVIPAVLLTGLDTARPGPVVATVSQNVFDTVSGRHRLIPQGARLIGRHEGESLWGDSRAFLVWDRLILPDGSSLILTEEPGVDARGAVGVGGQADRRLWSLGVASLFAGAITTLGELARGGRDDSRSLIGSAGNAAAIEASQVGGRLIDRELQVRPSIRVRPGAAVRVMITRDLILEPREP